MNKKRVTAFILAGIMILAMAGCGGNGDTGSGTNTDSGRTETSFEEVVVIDNSKYSMKITGINEGDRNQYSMNAVYENKLSVPKEDAEKSERNRLTFLVKEAYINGYSCAVVAGADAIEAGTSFESTIDISRYQLETKNITEVTKVELAVSISNADDWNQYYEEEINVVFYPQGEEKAVGQNYAVQSTDTVLAENENLKVVSLGEFILKDNVYGIRFYVENRTENEITIAFNDEKIDGVAIDPHASASVLPGRHDYVFVSWNEGDLKDAKVTDFNASAVKQVEFKLRVYNADLTQGIVEYLNETFTVTP